jgi:hypothetical protein
LIEAGLSPLMMRAGEKLMRKAQEYRHQAQSCLELANTAEDQFTKEAMKELATEFLKAADRLEEGLITPRVA